MFSSRLAKVYVCHFDIVVVVDVAHDDAELGGGLPKRYISRDGIFVFRDDFFSLRLNTLSGSVKASGHAVQVRGPADRLRLI